MLEISGRDLDRLVPIMAPERELWWREEKIEPGSMHVEDIWLKFDFCWGSLLVAYVGSGYLVMINFS